MRTSYSLNRINEIHETECNDNEEDNTGQDVPKTGDDSNKDDINKSCEKEKQISSRSRRQFTPQLSSESEGEPPPGNEILTRYLLDTIGRTEGRKHVRNRETTEDSLNSSDSEYNTEEDRRRNKVNLRQLEERLNMIQEECNRSDDAESDDERSATIDDRSDRNEPMDILDDSEILDCRNNNGDLQSDDEEDIQIDNDTRNQEFESVFNKIDLFLDNSKFSRRNSGRSRSEGINPILDIKLN